MKAQEAEKFFALPGIAELEEPAKALLLAQAQVQNFKAGTVLFEAGMGCHHFVLVRQGLIKVSVVAEGGRQIVLYRVGAGDICVLTTCCLMSNENYDADGVAETEVEALVLPKALFDELMRLSPKFSAFVFSSFGSRLHGLIALIQDVVERHVDRRLARYLVLQGKDIHMTHQQLALEIGTAREVVSRLLKDFEMRGWVQVGRGQIGLTNLNALKDYAQIS